MFTANNHQTGDSEAEKGAQPQNSTWKESLIAHKVHIIHHRSVQVNDTISSSSHNPSIAFIRHSNPLSSTPSSTSFSPAIASLNTQATSLSTPSGI